MPAPDELNDRQNALLAQVEQGGVTEEAPDTEEQLLRLAQLGHLTAEYADGEWAFTIPAEPDAEPEPEAEPQEG